MKNSKLEIIKRKLNIVIYGTNTRAGKLFDLILLVLILLSTIVIMLETVKSVDLRFHRQLMILEWIFTVLFTIEYALRIFCSPKPIHYIFSFYGIIDLLAILPMYGSFFLQSGRVFSSIRILRLLRLFRILSLGHFLSESNRLKVALMASRAKVAVFLYFVLIISVSVGTIMYFVEGPHNGFTSIPMSIFYTIVTMTTVGYGDMVPQTPLGQFLSAILMITGYGIIAVPTGIVGVELAKKNNGMSRTKEEVEEKLLYEEILNNMVCNHCGSHDHKDDARYCYKCGHEVHL